MFVFPYNTDAPLYHIPFATGGVIAANVLVYFATDFQVLIGASDPETFEWLMIQYDQINPLQWITGQFMHDGIGHLIGNMLFLFCFGVIVEGKIGNLPFIGLYLGLCLAIGMTIQVPLFLLGGEGHAVGASAAITALMVVAFFWAPENEISFMWVIIIFFYPLHGSFEARVITVCSFFVGMDLLFLFLNGFSMSGAMGHVAGAALGVPIGVVLLRTGKVDCEGWDLVSRNEWLHEYPLLYGEHQKQQNQSREDESEDPIATALQMTGGDASASTRIGLIAKRSQKKPAASQSPGVAGRKSRRPRKQSLREKKRHLTEDPRVCVRRCQSHAEFNRLAFVLRQTVQAQDLASAQDAFRKIDVLKIGPGLGEKTLFAYVQLLSLANQWVDTIRPLAILIEKQESMADDACLRLAKIQMQVMKRYDLALLTLAKIESPEAELIDSKKRGNLEKRDQMISVARQGTF